PGKSTLIKILAGVYTLDAGSVSFRGVEVTHALRRSPIALIHQDLGLIDWMTVAENICLTLGFPRRRGLIDWTAARRRAGAAVGKPRGGNRPAAPAGGRRVGNARRRHRPRRPDPGPEPNREVPCRDRPGALCRGRNPGA